MNVVSGGQTGVGRAALDAALAAGFGIGGWCPKGRRAEDDPIDERYPFIETKCNKYRTRTRWNVRGSDATLILCDGDPTGGTALTIQFCEQLNKPFLVISPSDAFEEAVAWIKTNQVTTLNVAGPVNAMTFRSTKNLFVGLRLSLPERISDQMK